MEAPPSHCSGPRGPEGRPARREPSPEGLGQEYQADRAPEARHRLAYAPERRSPRTVSRESRLTGLRHTRANEKPLQFRGRLKRVRQPVPRLRRSAAFPIPVPVLPDWADVWRVGPPGLEGCWKARVALPLRAIVLREMFFEGACRKDGRITHQRKEEHSVSRNPRLFRSKPFIVTAPPHDPHLQTREMLLTRPLPIASIN
jgi:hypothetical protein